MRFNPISALVAGIAFYAMQSVWYIVLGAAWQAASGVTPPAHPSAVPFVIGFVVALIVGFVVEQALHDTTNPNPPMHGIQFGLFFGIGIFALNLLVEHQFEQKPVALTLIDGGAVVLSLMVAGLVVGLFHRKNAKVA
jgi:hypothetical protein